MSIPKILPYTLAEALTPIPHSVNWSIQPEKAVLLVHDMQQYFVDFFDQNAEPMVTVLNNIQRLIQVAREQSIPVIYTAQPTHQEPSERALLTDFWGTGLKEGSQILPAIRPKDNDTIYTKWRYSAFQKSTLEDDLKRSQRNQLIICGVYAHIGILSTAVDGFMRDIQTFTIEDAIADFSAKEHAEARCWIAGRCGRVINTHEAIDQCQSSDWLKAMICDILEVSEPAISEHCDLTDWGLDSVRLMHISDRINTRGNAVDFIALGEKPYLKHWRTLLSEP